MNIPPNSVMVGTIKPSKPQPGQIVLTEGQIAGSLRQFHIYDGTRWYPINNDNLTPLNSSSFVSRIDAIKLGHSDYHTTRKPFIGFRLVLVPKSRRLA